MQNRLLEKKHIIVIFTGPMAIGGIEKSLAGVLESIDYNKYNVDFFLYAHHGELLDSIDNRVNLLPEVRELAFLRDSFKQKLKHGCFYSAYIRVRDELLSMLRIKQIDNDLSWAQVMRKTTPRIEKRYDLALGFFMPFDFLREKVNADIKVGWVHTDYTTESIDPDVLRREYNKLDYIACVSESVKLAFCSVVPEFTDKTIVVENCIAPEKIRLAAEQATDSGVMADSNGYFNLLSIGRFCNAKNFDNIPEICKKVIEHGLKVKWYLIGFGQDEELIRSRIKEMGMENNVIILGKKVNPYPYINACDLYVQPSRYEGRCVSVIEAQILQKPVVITNYVTAPSQLEDGFDGVIVPMDNEGCADGIAALLSNPAKMQDLSQNCGKRDYSNSSELRKLYQLMNKA